MNRLARLVIAFGPIPLIVATVAIVRAFWPEAAP